MARKLFWLCASGLLGVAVVLVSVQGFVGHRELSMIERWLGLQRLGIPEIGPIAIFGYEESADPLRARIEDATQRELQRSKVIIELDAPMIVGRDYQVTFAMQAKNAAGKTTALDEAEQAIPAQTLVSEEVETPPLVNATLSSADFIIEEQAGGWQLVLRRGVTLWTWRVQPKSAGERTLLFSLSGKIQVDGVDYIAPVENYPRNVTVQVEPIDYAAEAWRWVLAYAGPLIIGLCTVLGGFVSVIQLRDRRAAKRATDPEPPAPANDTAPIDAVPAPSESTQRPMV